MAEFTKKEFNFASFKILIEYIIFFYFFSLVLQWFMRKYGEALGPQMGNYIRLKYFKALEMIPFKNLVEQHSGYILSLINKVSDGITPIMFDIFWTFAKGISNIALFFYFTSKESVFIATINLVVLSIFVAISTFLSKKMVPIAGELNSKRASLLESYSDLMSNILTIKKLGIYSFTEKRLSDKTSDNYKQIQKLQNFHANRWLFLHSLYGTAFLSTIGFLLFQTAQGNISASVLILFIAAYATVRFNIERLSESFKALMEMKAYTDSLDKIIIPNEKIKAEKNWGAWREIKFKNVFFRYAKTEKQINIPDFYVKKGEKICLIGKSGEGKTTFLNLVANYLNPIEGKRFIDDHSYEEFDESLSKQIVFVSQEVELFNLSLKENIALGQKIEEKEIFNLLEKLDLLSWVKNMRDGLETIVGEKGVKLSAGQRQRINLLRGVLLNREIALLDEPTSHLDDATEKTALNF